MPGVARSAIRTFRADLKDWMETNAPHIHRKDHWQDIGQRRHVKLWHNSALDGLRLDEANDSDYLIGDPGREVWAGPDV